MRNFMNRIKVLGIAFVIMLIINTLVLYVYYDIRISDLVRFVDSWRMSDGPKRNIADSEGLLMISDELLGDGTTKRDGSSNGSDTAPGDDSAEESSIVSDDEVMANGSLTDFFDTVSGIEFLKKLSFMDKLNLTCILLRIDSGTLDRICTISNNGVTADEIEYIREHLRNSLDPSDVERLEDIYDRNSHLYADEIGN